MIFKETIKDCLGFIYFNGFRRYIKREGNRSLIYHAFGMKLKHDTYGISMEISKFKEHMEYLTDNYKIIHAYKSLKESQKSISITIDDGYKDTLDAVDILNNHKIPFTLFVTSAYIGQEEYLSRNDIHQIAKLDNAEIGSHGYSHKKLGLLNYQQQLIELTKSKKDIEDITRKPVTGISFPHGSHNTDTLSLLESTSYAYAMSSLKGINNQSCNKYLLRRSEIINRDTIDSLKKKIIGYYDYY